MKLASPSTWENSGEVKGSEKAMDKGLEKTSSLTSTKWISVDSGWMGGVRLGRSISIIVMLSVVNCIVST